MQAKESVDKIHELSLAVTMLMSKVKCPVRFYNKLSGKYFILNNTTVIPAKAGIQGRIQMFSGFRVKHGMTT